MKVQDEKGRKIILWFYRGRCIVCKKSSRIVHEIEPRSSGKLSLRLRNRVVLCDAHHKWAHNVGTKVSGEILKRKRVERILSLYG